MKLLALLGGDHPPLALAELVALCSNRDTPPPSYWQMERAVTIEAPFDRLEGLAGRLGLTRWLGRWWGKLDLDPPPAPAEVAQVVAASGGLEAGSFKVRASRLGMAPAGLHLGDYEREVGARLAGPANPVDLTQPEQTLRLVAGRSLWWGLEREPTGYRQARERHVRHRPHFAPISLHPRLARAMVNLARLPPGGSVLDPFCGTGGLLLEAGLLGYRCLGFDIQPAMVDGTRANLAHFKVVAERVEVKRLEVGGLPRWLEGRRPAPGRLAIVTDPPYGRSATTASEPLEELLGRAFAAFAQVMRPGERVVMVLPLDRLYKLGTKTGNFVLRELYQQRVHRSLTRFYGILERLG